MPSLEAQAEHSRKLSEARAREESLEAVRRDAQELRPPAETRPGLTPLEAVRPVSMEQLEPRELLEIRSPELQRVPPLVLRPEEQRLWAGLLRPEARPLVFLQEEARPAHDSPVDAARPAEPRLPSSE